MEYLITLWPYAIAAVAGGIVGLATYKTWGGKSWKAALKAVVAGVHEGKESLNKQGINYKENLTDFINAKIPNAKTRAILESVISKIEAASAPDTPPAPEKPDARDDPGTLVKND